MPLKNIKKSNLFCFGWTVLVTSVVSGKQLSFVLKVDFKLAMSTFLDIQVLFKIKGFSQKGVQAPSALACECRRTCISGHRLASPFTV